MYSHSRLNISGQTASDNAFLIHEGSVLSCINSTSGNNTISVENFKYGLNIYGSSLLPTHITGASVAEYVLSSTASVLAIEGKWVNQA